MSWCNLSSSVIAAALFAAGCSASPEAPAAAMAGAGGAPSAGAAGAVASGGTLSASGASNDAGRSGAFSLAGSAGAGSASAASAASGAAGNGTAGAAGSGSAAGATARAGASSSSDCPSGAVFCDDFEGLTAMAPPTGKWAARTGGMATVTVDTEHAHSGSKAVHFHSASVDNNQRAYMITQGVPGFPVASDTLYVRFMFYIGRYISTGSSVHNRIVWVGSSTQLASGGGEGDGYIFATYNGIAIERLQTNHGFQRDTTQHMDDPSRANKWQCFEFEIDNKGGVPAGEKASSTALPHIWQDGAPLKLSAGGSSEAWLPTPFEAVQFSLWCPQSDPKPTDYWIDDVVVSKQRINCPTAP